MRRVVVKQCPLIFLALASHSLWDAENCQPRFADIDSIKDKAVVLYCASGGRSALGGKVLRELGYKSVYNAGAFKDLAEAGMEMEPA